MQTLVIFILQIPILLADVKGMKIPDINGDVDTPIGHISQFHITLLSSLPCMCCVCCAHAPQRQPKRQRTPCESVFPIHTHLSRMDLFEVSRTHSVTRTCVLNPHTTAYSISNLVIKSVTLGASAASFTPTGVALSITQGAMSGTSNWHYREDSWPHVSDSGTVDISVNDFSITATIDCVADPKTHAPQVCVCVCVCVCV
jgi:hypothetical protein